MKKIKIPIHDFESFKKIFRVKMGKPYFDILEVPVFKVHNATTIGKRTKKGGRFLFNLS